MCKASDVECEGDQHRRKHSLRAVTPTRSLNAGMSVKDAMLRTRHKYVRSLAQYDHTDAAKIQDLHDVLSMQPKEKAKTYEDDK